MKVRLDPLYQARYPFLKESRGIIEEITKRPLGERELKAAIERIREAVLFKSSQTWTDKKDLSLDISSYIFAHVLVSCVRNRQGIMALARYEANRALYFLQMIEDNNNLRHDIYHELGIPFSGGDMHFTRYIEITSNLREEQFRFVNRDLRRGMVIISDEEKELLIRERIKTLILDQLPLALPVSICTQLSSAVAEVEEIIAERGIVEYGDVDKAGFPPCIRELYDAALHGKYLSHSGRFALTTFLKTIGMDITCIISLFSDGGDFNLDITSYQVDHITSYGDSGYTAPNCATMRTHGICVGKNKTCEQVNHPLNYYRKQKKTRKRNTQSKENNMDSGDEKIKEKQ